MVHLPRVDLLCYPVFRVVFSFDLHFFFASFVVGSFFCNLCLLFSPRRTDLFVVVSHMIILAIVAHVWIKEVMFERRIFLFVLFIYLVVLLGCLVIQTRATIAARQFQRHTMEGTSETIVSVSCCQV